MTRWECCSKCGKFFKEKSSQWIDRIFSEDSWDGDQKRIPSPLCEDCKKGKGCE